MQDQRLYTIQDYFIYNNIYYAFPIAISSTLNKAKKRVDKRVQQALTEFKNKGYSVDQLSIKEIDDIDAIYEIGIYDNDERLLERISAYCRFVDYGE